MAKIYYRKIKESGGAYTIDMVPERWRSAVQELLDADSKVVEPPAADEEASV